MLDSAGNLAYNNAVPQNTSGNPYRHRGGTKDLTIISYDLTRPDHRANFAILGAPIWRVWRRLHDLEGAADAFEGRVATLYDGARTALGFVALSSPRHEYRRGRGDVMDVVGLAGIAEAGRRRRPRLVLGPLAVGPASEGYGIGATLTLHGLSKYSDAAVLLDPDHNVRHLAEGTADVPPAERPQLPRGAQPNIVLPDPLTGAAARAAINASHPGISDIQIFYREA